MRLGLGIGIDIPSNIYPETYPTADSTEVTADSTLYTADNEKPE